MQSNTGVEVQYSGSNQKSQMPAVQVTSADLPKNVSMRLYELMNAVVEEGVTPARVNAACSCASSIHKMLKLNLEIMKNSS